VAKSVDNEAPKITIKLDGSEDADEICSMIRGLLYSVRQNDGYHRKNTDFYRGTTIIFSVAPFAGLFLEAAERLFAKRVWKRLKMKRHY
jgi:hypothetical protein